MRFAHRLHGLLIILLDDLFEPEGSSLLGPQTKSDCLSRRPRPARGRAPRNLRRLVAAQIDEGCPTRELSSLTIWLLQLAREIDAMTVESEHLLAASGEKES
jgi:hypothetical protein